MSSIFTSIAINVEQCVTNERNPVDGRMEIDFKVNSLKTLGSCVLSSFTYIPFELFRINVFMLAMQIFPLYTRETHLPSETSTFV